MSWAAIVVASLLGSLHCVGMCGGIVAALNIATAPRGAVQGRHLDFR